MPSCIGLGAPKSHKVLTMELTFGSNNHMIRAYGRVFLHVKLVLFGLLSQHWCCIYVQECNINVATSWPECWYQEQLTWHQVNPNDINFIFLVRIEQVPHVEKLGLCLLAEHTTNVHLTLSIPQGPPGSLGGRFLQLRSEYTLHHAEGLVIPKARGAIEGWKQILEITKYSHHAEGLVNPKVRAQKKGYWFWILQNM
jgi:hypothetical protein